MPYDPNLPQPNTPVDANQIRAQLQGLNTLIEQAVSGSSANSNGVDFANVTFSDPPTQGECQALQDKLNELIQALRR